MKLDDLDKPQGLFKTPDGYFDRLTGQVQRRVQTPAAPGRAWQAVWQSLRSVYTGPALALGLLLFWLWPGIAPVPATLEGVPAGQVQAYLLDQNLDEELIVEQLDAAGRQLGLQEAGVDLPVDPDLLDDLDLDQIEEALQ
jgi:hypothetical protein